MAVHTPDVAAEAILLAGGARALLLQLANPGVGHGVAEHSDFENRPLDRLNGTLTYLYVVAYGSPEEVRVIARRVGAAHRPVTGANDPALQLWVAATLYEGGVRMHELVFGPLPDEARQALLDDGATIATALGVPRALWPETPSDFARYWDRCVGELRVDDVARGVARALLHPVRVPWWFRVALPSVRVLTAGLLSPELRAAYELPFDERRFQRLVRMIRLIYPRLPLVIRHAPKRRYLAAFRRSLG
jgi:uncharacterized protein (DUF2236 family)